MLLDARRTKSVDHVCKISALALLYTRLFDDKKSENTDKCDRDTDDAEYRRPGPGQIEIERHKSAEHRKYCHKRHHRIYSLCRASVALVGRVGQPRVICGIVGTRAKEGHNAVKNDHERHRKSRSRGDCGKQRAYPIDTQERKAEDRHAPKDVAEADKYLSLSDLVGKCAHKHGRQRSRDRARGYHSRDVGCRRAEHLIDKDVEIHILNHPRYLTYKSEQHEREPKSRAKASLIFTNHKVFTNHKAPPRSIRAEWVYIPSAARCRHFACIPSQALSSSQPQSRAEFLRYRQSRRGYIRDI